MQSGQADVGQLLAELESMQSLLREKLQKLGVTSAEGRQLIILTCEPETAKVLGGCLIDLAG